MNEIELGHLERVTNICANRGDLIVKQANRIIELAEARGYDEVKIADLEAANILLNNTINVQLQVIREHEAADVIAVEAIRSQADEIKQLKAAIKELELDDDYGYAEQKNFD